MNLDIETEHVLLRPEWSRMVDEWAARCAKGEPDVAGLDVILRHGERPGGEEAEIVVTAGGRRLRAGARGDLMGTALHDALDSIEGQLLELRRARRAAERRAA